MSGGHDEARLEASPAARELPGPQAASGGGIAIEDLHVRAGDRTLLAGAGATFPEGRVTLVIGASGAGKTVLMRILAGLIRPGAAGFEVRGSIRIGAREVLGRRASPGETGIVFQNFALFDELTPAGNIEFAADHRRHPAPREAGLDALSLLEEFRVPSGTPVRSLSGGQQQRLAIARTLAYDPPVLIYDEPTSGLDPANARHVAERIRTTCRSRGKTTVVVTHDYLHLAPIADRIYLLDPDRQELRELAPGEVDGLESSLPGTGAFEEGRAAPSPGLGQRALEGAIAFFAASGAVLDRSVAALAALVPIWPSPRWGVRYFLYYLGLIASAGSWIYFAAAGSIAGFVTTYFSYQFLPHRKYSEPLIGDEVLNAVGFALYRVVVPVLITILLAARCGAAVASDVGNRAYAHQLDAMRSLGARPERYLLSSILHSFLAATPFLVAMGFFGAWITSLVVFLASNPEKGAQFWESHFHRDLIVPGQMLYRGTWWLAAKVLASGFGIGAIAYYQGARPKSSGVEVSRTITSTVIWATLYVLLVHFAFALLEFPVPEE